MAGNDKNLHETLKDVLGETTTPQNTNKETKEGISEAKSGETKSGETPEYVFGVDISKYPEQERPLVKKVLEEKGGLLEKGYQGKFQEVAQLKKAQDEILKLGLDVNEVQKVVVDYAEKKKNPQDFTKQEKQEAKSEYETLLENAPSPEARAALKRMEKVMLEFIDKSPVKKELDETKKKLAYFEGKDLQLGEQGVVSDLNSLKDKFGKDLIEKYQDIVKSEWRKYPNSKAKDILKYVVPDDEYEQALLSKATKPIREKEKAKASASPGSGLTGATEAIETKGKTLGGVLRDVIALQRK